MKLKSEKQGTVKAHSTPAISVDSLAEDPLEADHRAQAENCFRRRFRLRLNQHHGIDLLSRDVGQFGPGTARENLLVLSHALWVLVLVLEKDHGFQKRQKKGVETRQPLVNFQNTADYRKKTKLQDCGQVGPKNSLSTFPQLE